MNTNNSETTRLLLPEYGRNVQKMVEYLLTIEDRDLRNSQAKTVVGIMRNLNSQLRDSGDMEHKFWDHLFMISDFKLDVDSPFPTPSPELIHPHPERIAYPDKTIKHKEYGRNVIRMVNLIKTLDNEESKMFMANNIARYMKVKAYEFNNEYPANETILQDMRELSNGELNLNENILNSTRPEYKSAARPAYKNNKNSSAGGGSKNKQNNNGHPRKLFNKKRG